MLDLETVRNTIECLSNNPASIAAQAYDVGRLMRAMLSEMEVNRAELAGYRAANTIGHTLSNSLSPQYCWLVCGNDLYTSEEEAWKAAAQVLDTEINQDVFDEQSAEWIRIIRIERGNREAITLSNRLRHPEIRVEKLELKTKYEPKV